jgi:hypothetical protein
MTFPLHTEIRTPAQLTAAARAAYDAFDALLPLASILPTTLVASDQYEFVNEDKQDVDEVGFLAFDTTTPYGRTHGTSAKIGYLPPLGKSQLITEKDVRNGGDLGTVFEQRAIQTAEEAVVRLEKARAVALENGALKIQDNNLNFTIPFGRSGDHTVTAAPLWTAANSDPVADLITWQGVDGVQDADTLLISKTVLTALATNAKVIAAYEGRGDNLPSRISFTQVQSVFAGYGINLVEITSIYSNLVLGGQRINFPSPFSANKVLLVRSSGVGQTQLGLATEINEPSYGLTGSGPGLVSAAFVRNNPVGFDVMVRGLGLPVLTAPNHSLVATVA